MSAYRNDENARDHLLEHFEVENKALVARNTDLEAENLRLWHLVGRRTSRAAPQLESEFIAQLHDMKAALDHAQLTIAGLRTKMVMILILIALGTMVLQVI